MLIGYLLLVSACGMDACEALPVTEDIYPTYHECMQVAERVRERRPAVILICAEVYH